MSELTIELSEEQVQQLRDGEEIRIATQIREPLYDNEIPSSLNHLTVQLSTTGLVGQPADWDEFREEFDEMENLDGAIEQFRD